jgi:hypothetical protein
MSSSFFRFALRAGALVRALLSLVLSLLPVGLIAAPGDEHWDAQFGWPGPGQTSYAVTVHKGFIYASGIGSSSTNTALEMWNGAQWTALTQLYGPAGTTVRDLAFVGDTLYVAGVFTNIGGLTITNLAKWDGTNWSGVGFNQGTPYSLAVDGNNLYVGGGFTSVGGVAITNIGWWDGAAWHALGNGLGGTNLSIVYSVAATNGSVYGAGYFTNSGSLLLSSNVARWNGASWTALGNGVGNTVLSIALQGTSLYAASLFGSPATVLAKWDGANWSLCGGGFDSAAQSVAVLGNLVCVAGAFTTTGSTSASRFAVWNGSSWAAAGSGLSATGVRVYSTGTNVYVGGNFLLAGGLIANGLAGWDGTNWSQVGSPGRMNGLATSVSALASDGVNLYAGGNFTGAGQTNANYLARFNGTNWYPLGSGASGSSTPSVNAVAVSGNYVYAGGSFTTAGGVSAINMASWDGTNWSALGSGPGGLVYAVTARPEGVYAAGAPYSSGSGYGTPFFLLWDGSSWQSVLNFNSNDTFFDEYLNDSVVGMAAMAFLGTDIYVGGHFIITWHDPQLMNFTNCNNILRFDGTYARVVGTGLNSNVVAMAVMGGNLYVAGAFTNAGGSTVSHIAMWDGNNWWDVGGGVVGKGSVLALTTIGNNLYAAGTFTNMGGVPANRVAKWDGSAWSALGSGTTIPGSTSGTAGALAGVGNDLYVGGNFRMAGAMPSYSIGRWNDQLTFNTPRLLNPAWLGNGMFRTRLFGVSYVTNIIQATTNFASWTPVLTNSVGIYDFTDASAGSYPRRFYRAVLGQ